MSMDDQTDPRGATRNRRHHAGALAHGSVSALRDHRVGGSIGLRQFVVDHLMRALLSVTAISSHTLLEQLMAHRVAVNNISDNYVPHAARLLGKLWVSDDITFSQVTIGTLRLQSLIEVAADLAPIDVTFRADRPQALVLIPRNEQHFLGASVLFGQLRRLSCDVAMSFDEGEQALTNRLMREKSDIVLISCSRIENIATVRETVATIRAVAPEGCVIALGGAIDADAGDLKESTGVDIVTNSAADALAFCQSARRMAACS